MPKFDVDIKRIEYGYVTVQAKDKDSAIKQVKNKTMKLKGLTYSCTQVEEEPVDVHEEI